MAETERPGLGNMETNFNDTANFEKPVEVDTVHGDEATKVLASYDGPLEWTPQEEKMLVRKIDRRLLWILLVTNGLQFYDKSMLAHAALFGLRDDLQLRIGDRYPMSSAIFYLGYIGGAYPAVALSQRYPVERVVFSIVMLWGICLISTAAVTNFRGLYAQRFFLGFLEAGVSPGFVLVVGGWYRKNEQAFRNGIWYSATGFVTIIAPLINYGLGHIQGALSSWQYMYLVAGAATIAWSFFVLLYMPPDPIRAKGFTDRERYIAVARMRENNSGVRNTHFKIGQVKELVMDKKFWLMFLASFCMLFVNGPVTTFLPIIINQLGFTGLTSLLLVMPAGVVIGTTQLVATYCAMRFKNTRCWIIVSTVTVTLIASILLWQLPISQVGGRLFAVYIIAFFGGGYAVLIGLVVTNCAGYTKRSLSSSSIFVAYCLGNFIGPLTFYEREAPYYNTGWITTVVTLVVSILLIILYRFVCLWDNRKRDKTGLEAFDHAYEDDFTDKTNRQFRYTL